MNSLITFSLNSTYPSTQEHSFYSAFIEDSGSQMTLDLHADVSGSTISQQFVQTLLLDNAPYVAPGSVSSFPSTNLGQTTSKTSSASSYTSCWWILSLVCGLTVLSMVLWLQPKNDPFLSSVPPTTILFFHYLLDHFETSWTLSYASGLFFGVTIYVSFIRSVYLLNIHLYKSWTFYYSMYIHL